MTTRFTKPDRSGHRPNFRKTDENPALDIGWNEGFLSDGRVYRAEAWAEDGITSLTFFMPTAEIEQLTNAGFVELLEREGLVAWQPGRRRSAFAMPVTDSAGHSVWSVNVVIAAEDETIARSAITLRPYASA